MNRLFLVPLCTLALGAAASGLGEARIDPAPATGAQLKCPPNAICAPLRTPMPCPPGAMCFPWPGDRR